jgi:hypothetical protein
VDLLRELRVLKEEEAAEEGAKPEDEEEEEEEGESPERGGGGAEAVYEGQHAGLPIDGRGVVLDMV